MRDVAATHLSVFHAISFLRGTFAVPLLGVLLSLTACGDRGGGDEDLDAAADRALEDSLPGGSDQVPGETPQPDDTTADIDAETPADTGAAGAGGTSSVGGGGTTAAASEPGDVSWMTVDESARLVHFDVVAGLTPENSSWNFNGYANGAMTITVPKDWTVTLTFTNKDGDVPHSLYFLDTGPPFPDDLPDKPAIPRAYTSNLKNGLGEGKSDKLRFPVPTAGKFTMVCGVYGHGRAGMWDWFVVSAEARRPTVTFAA